MPETPDFSWPPMAKRRLIGKRISRVDGAAKSSGHARYAYDLQRPGMLQTALLTCPHAHARLTAIDTSAAEKSPGVMAIDLLAKPGEEIQYAGYEVAAVAATSLEAARDALPKIKVTYEVLPHLVNEEDLSKAGSRAKASGAQTTGDPDQAFKDADAVSEGFYGIHVLNHCCLEAHGQVIEWKGDEFNYWPSTQFVSGVGGDLAKALGASAANVHTHMDFMGGGFGSKFSHDRWGESCARLSKASGGRPVKFFLDRNVELEIAGSRPSYFANIKVGAKKDGTMTVWDSDSWGTGGFSGVNLPPGALPYIFREVPNRRMKHTSVSTNAAQQRAWRAPNHPQLSYLTCAAMEDLAAKLNMDPVEFFDKNLDYATGSPGTTVYREQLRKAAEMAEWKKLWHPRGQSGSGTVKRGLGIGFNMWGGFGHASNCRTKIHPDGSVEVEIGTQDLGTGTRTVISIVAAETLGLPLHAVKVLIGDNKYPVSGASGGSTTVGGVSASTRKSTVNALAKLFEVAAPALGVTADQLEAVDGKIQVKADPSKNLTWEAACRKLGARSIEEMGQNNPRSPGGLISGGVGGAQIADVSVDTETGLTRINRIVAVQDCGMVIDPKTAESQCYGGIIMSISGALMEERIMDPATGRILNADMEFYKLPGFEDVGEIVVHLNRSEEYDKRGVIGLGEPPAIGGIAAIANAVTNAIGVRPPVVPLTPDQVLAALERRKA
jgi:xanthine dehydrogenase YagR molybdenum-binding subunit